MKKYFTPECDLQKVTPKEDILFISLNLSDEELAPEVGYDETDKWSPVGNG